MYILKIQQKNVVKMNKLNFQQKLTGHATANSIEQFMIIVKKQNIPPNLPSKYGTSKSNPNLSTYSSSKN